MKLYLFFLLIFTVFLGKGYLTSWSPKFFTKENGNSETKYHEFISQSLSTPYSIHDRNLNSEKSKIFNTVDTTTEQFNTTSQNITPSIPSSSNAFHGKVWAVLVAGSRGYYNYRHQADLCHAYQVLKANGLPDSQIIVMMYDDIAYNQANPFQGELINEPNGTNVYKGVPKDFTGSNVTPANFLRLLRGDESLRAEGHKTLDSGPNDHVFIFFTDHGGQGLLMFPNEALLARPLNEALLDMKKAKRFKQLVFYVEACESGSMFENLLPKNESIFVVTASNADESSFACFFDSDRGTYLADVFSFAWLMDSQKLLHMRNETLALQVDKVRKRTDTSHVSKYGDEKIARELSVQFEGDLTNEPDSHHHLKTSSGSILYKEDMLKQSDRISSRHAPIQIARWRAEKWEGNRREKAIQEYRLLDAGRRHIDRIMWKLTNKFSNLLHVSATELNNKKVIIHSYDCYEQLLNELSSSCFSLPEHPYALTGLNLLVNVCNFWTADGSQKRSSYKLLKIVRFNCLGNQETLKRFGSVH